MHSIVDNDGDKALVVAEKSLIQAAERECADVVPLYYPMAKAGAVEVTPISLYNGMVAAWTGGNIGEISNSITKIWNSPEPDVDAVKILCMQNNFVIDYAKTLYKPTCPPEWEKRLHNAVSGKVPAFFVYAKGKTERQVAPRANGVVDRIYKIIQIYKFRFNAAHLGNFDYRMLMYNENIPYGEPERKIVNEFRKASASMGNVNGGGIHDENSQYWFQIKELRKKILEHGSVQYVSDVLVRGLFHEHKVRKKAAFWACFGDVIYENLENNLPVHTRVCKKCGKRYRITNTSIYCPECEPLAKQPEIRTAYCIMCGEPFATRDETSGAMCPACKLKYGEKKRCIDCGAILEDVGRKRGHPVVRCPSCQAARNRQKVREWKIKHKKN